MFRVTDRGSGFDHRAFLDSLDDRADHPLQHGRGLMMAVNAFDLVKYNERGNEVTLIKRFVPVPTRE